ncbi:MAG TPA: hypothetical protein VMR06_17600 [Dokdonella sp.]|uniref:hypothetical protein n=1 Tax=Dokdonella sp. TaxID=2291710 RepID=UPI002BD35C08|nr:hypothetical protein [Dokdonella sp.]HUD43803.1 hypothetical protein [Dokdonella sp.]
MAFSKTLVWVLLLVAGNVSAALVVGAPALETRSHWDEPAFGPCGNPVLSRTAAYLTFWCVSGDIVVGDDNDRSDVFLLDRSTQGVQRVSVDSLQMDYRFDSGGGVPSDDGREVLFISYGPLDPILPWKYHDNGIGNAFLRDVVTNTTSLVGQDHMGAPRLSGTVLAAADFSADEVVFASTDNLLGGEDINGPFSYDIYIRNWRSGRLELISGADDVVQGDCGSGNTAILSDDGRYVVFDSCSANLTSDNPDGVVNLFIHDRFTGEKRRLTRPWHGGEFSYRWLDYVIGAGSRKIMAGRYVAFSSFGTEFVKDMSPDSANPNSYLIDIRTGGIELISRAWDGSPAALGGSNIDMSADGRYIAFASRSSDILPDPGPTPAIYVKDRWTGEIVNASASLGPMHPAHVADLDLSDDGSTLAFAWRYSDTAAAPYSGRTLIYTVSINGAPIEPVVPMPVPSTSVIVRLSAAALLLLTGIGWLSRRRGSTQ